MSLQLKIILFNVNQKPNCIVSTMGLQITFKWIVQRVGFAEVFSHKDNSVWPLILLHEWLSITHCFFKGWPSSVWHPWPSVWYPCIWLQNSKPAANPTKTDNQETRAFFSELVQGEELFEICQMFTAALQLVRCSKLGDDFRHEM